jgi:hypothetical protein
MRDIEMIVQGDCRLLPVASADKGAIVRILLTGVFYALSVARTEWGDTLFLKMTRGACEQALDRRSFDLWQA